MRGLWARIWSGVIFAPLTYQIYIRLLRRRSVVNAWAIADGVNPCKAPPPRVTRRGRGNGVRPGRRSGGALRAVRSLGPSGPPLREFAGYQFPCVGRAGGRPG